MDDYDAWLEQCARDAICPYCGGALIDDMEAGQGYCVTAPCWMYGTGLRAEAVQWEQEHAQGGNGAAAAGG